MPDIATVCERLADFHGGMDLAERIKHALDMQREQRVALALAAEAIRKLQHDNATLRTRVAELEQCSNSILPST